MQEIFDVLLILSAFGGGILGAAIGALPSFIFCGLLVIVGEVLVIAGGPAVITSNIAFGPFFGPHIGFAAGVAAAAYAAKRGYMPSGKDTASPLMKLGKWDILFVGGIFGVVGYLVNGFFVALGFATDTVALTVVTSAIIVRLIWSNTGVFGKYDPKLSSSRWNIPESIAWVPFQMNPGQLIMIGLGVGLISSYAALITGSAVIGFGIAATSLIFAMIIGGVPVIHHIALPAALAAIATNSIFVGALFGILGAFAGEFFARIFHDWGDTQIDPPAAAIATLTTVILFVL